MSLIELDPAPKWEVADLVRFSQAPAPLQQATPEVKALLYRARQRIAEWGWTRGSLLDPPSGRVCALGALLGAATGIERVQDRGLYRFVIEGGSIAPKMIELPVVMQAASHIAARLATDPIILSLPIIYDAETSKPDPGAVVAGWNDLTSEATVCRMLEDAAQ